MTRSEPEDYEASFLRRARWYGRLRILPDGRIRFSDWSYTDLPHISIQVTRSVITVYFAGTPVMYLDPEWNRIVSACFLFDLKPELLRITVNSLRRARGGLDSWVVPALEFNSAIPTVRRDYPETFKIIPELLASCRDLPVARQWQRVRAQYFINQQVDPPVLPTVEDTPAGKPRGKRPAGKATTPRKQRKASKGRRSQRD